VCFFIARSAIDFNFPSNVEIIREEIKIEKPGDGWALENANLTWRKLHSKRVEKM
jgi:hypothetical protein